MKVCTLIIVIMYLMLHISLYDEWSWKIEVRFFDFQIGKALIDFQIFDNCSVNKIESSTPFYMGLIVYLVKSYSTLILIVLINKKIFNYSSMWKKK